MSHCIDVCMLIHYIELYVILLNEIYDHNQPTRGY